MKILFLDIDGVILPFHPESRDVSRHCAARINLLCKELGLKVVISSSRRSEALKEVGAHNWDRAHTTDTWRGIYHWLNRNTGLDVEVVGVTPLMGDPSTVIPGVRGDEIMVWLDKHPEVTEWMVVDDFAEWLGPNVMHRAVITEQNYAGFDDAALEAARKLFT